MAHSTKMRGRQPSGGVYVSDASFRNTIRSRFVDVCAVCGWTETTNDVCHIVPRKRGGENTFENIVMLCPNHHRMLDSGKMTRDEVRAVRHRCIPESRMAA